MRKFRPEYIPSPKNSFELPQKALDIEIGCGVGLHPLQYCSNHPERYLVAIEHSKHRFRKFQRRMENHPVLENLEAICEDAISWVTHNLSKSCVENYFLLYPNPHKTRARWHRLPFTERMLYSLKNAGKITLATNIQSYYEEAKEYYLKEWKLDCIEDKIVDFPARTHFERKYLERKEICWNLIFQKN